MTARGERADAIHTAAWCENRITFDHRRWSCADADLAWQAPHHLIVLTEEGGTSRTHVRIGRRPSYDGHDRPGALSFVPALTERRCMYRNADLVYSALWIEPAFAEHVTGGGRPRELAPVINGDDPVIAALLASVRTEITAGRQPATSYIEHLAALVLLRIAALDGRMPRTASGGRPLSHKAMASVENYVEAHLGDDISVAALAAHVDMPVERFARRFKATTGLAPYAYVIGRRVRRAEALLKRTDREIAAIALVLGFSSQSHFTTAFRRATGATPAAYRGQSRR